MYERASFYFHSTSLDFALSDTTAFADFELLNSVASGLQLLIGKFTFTSGQIILHLEKYSYCVHYSTAPSGVKSSLDAKGRINDWKIQSW